MRGDEQRQGGFIVLTSLEDRVPADHPLRAIRDMVDEALEAMSPVLEALHASSGRPSIAPEYLLRAQLVQILYAIPSERRLVEHLEYNPLLRWFVGVPMDEPLFHVTSFTKNRRRLLTNEVAEAFFAAIRGQAETRQLLSREHFSIDGTLIEAAAALKSLRAIEEGEDEEPPASGGGRNPDVDWRGERRGNRSHRSTTDPEARLARKGDGREARLCYAGHTLIENRHGLIVDLELTQASGTAEREAGLRLLARERTRRRRGRMSVAADKGFDVKDFVAGARQLHVTPHVARKKRGGAIDGRTTRHEGYGISLRRRKRIEEGHGWMKDVGGLGKLHHRGAAKVAAIFTITCAAYNLVRLRRLLAEPALTQGNGPGTGLPGPLCGLAGRETRPPTVLGHTTQHLRSSQAGLVLQPASRPLRRTSPCRSK